jgi:hypothetical protein
MAPEKLCPLILKPRSGSDLAARNQSLSLSSDIPFQGEPTIYLLIESRVFIQTGNAAQCRRILLTLDALIQEAGSSLSGRDEASTDFTFCYQAALSGTGAI